MPEEWAGLDTMIPPVVSFVVFITVALATQNRYPGKARHDVRDYVPPEEDVITGEDLKHFREDFMSSGLEGVPQDSGGDGEEGAGGKDGGKDGGAKGVGNVPGGVPSKGA